MKVEITPTIDDLTVDIQTWGKVRGIDNPTKQFAKIVEEVGELAHELTRGNCGGDSVPSLEAVDAIGDIYVTLAIFSDIVGIDIKEAINMAYSTIQNRTGKSIDGCFVKDESN